MGTSPGDTKMPGLIRSGCISAGASQPALSPLMGSRGPRDTLSSRHLHSSRDFMAQCGKRLLRLLRLARLPQKAAPSLRTHSQAARQWSLPQPSPWLYHPSASTSATPPPSPAPSPSSFWPSISFRMPSIGVEQGPFLGLGSPSSRTLSWVGSLLEVTNQMSFVNCTDNTVSLFIL